MINCPYYASCDRNISVCLGKKCKFYNAFSDEFKNYIESVKTNVIDVVNKKDKSPPEGVE